MIVIKKSGNKEEFFAEKIINSIAAASDEASQPLNTSDLKLILDEFQQIIDGKEQITSQQIDIIIFGILYTYGYYDVLKNFANYSKKR